MSYKWDTTAAAAAATSSPTTTGQVYNAMTVVQLKDELGKYGLLKTGTKAVLQDRLRQHQLLLRAVVPDGKAQQQKDGSSSGVGRSVENESSPTANVVKQEDRTSSNSIGMGLSADIAAILQRRREIHKQKSQPVTTKNNKNNNSNNNDSQAGLANARQVLQKIYQKPSSSLEGSQHASRVYQAAKEADQAGDRETAKFLLRSLDHSHDARILRRLARLEEEDGNTEIAKQLLQQGLATHHQNNPYLWQGLAGLEDTVEAKRQCYQKAIAADPHFAHAYHALATLEHTDGRIKPALEVLQTGLRHCPTNHRLHHALGDLYRDAKILPRATASYHKALEYGPPISHGYAVTALAFCAYEEHNMDMCRTYLQRAIDDNPRQAHAWMSLAQFEESLGNVEIGRNVCRTAIAQYERYLLKKYQPKIINDGPNNMATADPVAYKNELLRKIPRKRSGDKFIHVYRTWLRMEGRYGTVESFEEVYQQASAAFTDVRIQLDAAQYYASHGLNELARKRFMEACKSWSQTVGAFHIFGLHEMKLGNFALAERIFYTGAMTGRSNGLAELLYAWAVCEWQTDQPQNAARLFEFAIEESGHDVRLRSFILYVAARFELSRDEYHRAQHFVGRCLADNPTHMPGGKEQVWTLWKKIAEQMGDNKLAEHCHQQAWQSVLDENEATRVQKGDLQQQIRREPWTSKILSLRQDSDSIYNLSLLPTNDDISLFENSFLTEETPFNA
jgi:tetratricopeptide (TPR) repeat protein